jgi:spore maturation protein CgeB
VCRKWVRGLALKITIFGLTISSSWGNGHATPYRAILKALHHRGHRIVFYEKDVEYYALRRDFTQCSFCDLVLYSTWEEVRERALGDAADSDVIMTASYCPEGARINDALLQLDRPLHVYYDLDTPVSLNNLNAGDLPYVTRQQIPAFDLVLSWTGGDGLTELTERWGARMVRPLFGCVDPDIYHRVDPRPEFTSALSYMGTYAADRQQKVDDLFLEPARRREDLEFVLAGTFYPWHWQWPANVRRFDHVAPEQHPGLYSSSRITLNITREDMARSGWCPSGRFFEAAACGTPIISDWWNGLDDFFKPGQEIVLASSSDDVIAALAMSDEDLQRIAARARERTLSENTGEHRAEELLKYFDEAQRSANSWVPSFARAGNGVKGGENIVNQEAQS